VRLYMGGPSYNQSAIMHDNLHSSTFLLVTLPHQGNPETICSEILDCLDQA
jgi:hypothetical protein